MNAFIMVVHSTAEVHYDYGDYGFPRGCKSCDSVSPVPLS